MQSAERLRVNPEHTSDSQHFITLVDAILDANPHTRAATIGPYQFCEVAVFDFLSSHPLRNIQYHDLSIPAYGFAFRQRADFTVEDEIEGIDTQTKPHLYEQPINHTLFILTPEIRVGPTATQGQLTVIARNGQFTEGDRSPVDIMTSARTFEHLVSTREYFPNGDDHFNSELEQLWKAMQEQGYDEDRYQEETHNINRLYVEDRDLHPEWYSEQPEYASLAADLEHLFRAGNVTYRDGEQTDAWIRESTTPHS